MHRIAEGVAVDVRARQWGGCESPGETTDDSSGLWEAGLMGQFSGVLDRNSKSFSSCFWHLNSP